MSYKEKHIKQVSSYVHAIKEITSAEVEGYLCYLLKDEVKIIKV